MTIPGTGSGGKHPETRPHPQSAVPRGTGNRKIRILGVPLDLGQSRRGVDMGPSGVRIAGLKGRLEALGHRVEDAGNVPVDIAGLRASGEPAAKYLDAIAETCRHTASQTMDALAGGWTPLLLGGDHSIAAGSVSGVAEFYRRKEQKLGLIWIDAHADMNTPETSPSGNVHGMPLAALLGLGPDPLKTSLAGTRKSRRKTLCFSVCAISTPPKSGTFSAPE